MAVAVEGWVELVAAVAVPVAAFVGAGAAFHVGPGGAVEGHRIHFLDHQVGNDRADPAAGRTGEAVGHRGVEEEADHASCPLCSWIHR